MEIHEVPIGLNDHDDAGDGLRVPTRCPEERLQGIGGALAQFPQEAAIFSEVDAQHLRHGEHVLAMGDRGQHVLGDPFPELEHALLVTGGTEVSPLARQRQQILVPAGVAVDPREPLGEITAGEEFLDDPADEK